MTNFQLDYNTMNTEIQKQFVSHEIAVRLKTLGFNEPCLGWFPNSNTKKVEFTPNVLWVHSEGGSNIPAPIFEQVINWLDEKHKIRISLGTAKTSGKYRFDIIQFTEDKWQGDYNLTSFYDSRERNIKAIETALQLI